MRKVRNYGDRRQVEACAFCRGVIETRDHVPSRIFLDEPLPADLPVVPACLRCNNGISADEEYLACLLECIISGTTDSTKLGRAKIRRSLEQHPHLQAKLAAAHRQEDGKSVFDIERERIERVLVKLARGHSLFELNEPQLDPPSSLWMIPLHLLDSASRKMFESVRGGTIDVWPEVGSRTMQRLVEEGEYAWLEVQPGRYRYWASANSAVIVRMVLHEYLACEVTWNDNY